MSKTLKFVVRSDAIPQMVMLVYDDATYLVIDLPDENDDPEMEPTAVWSNIGSQNNTLEWWRDKMAWPQTIEIS